MLHMQVLWVAYPGPATSPLAAKAVLALSPISCTALLGDSTALLGDSTALHCTAGGHVCTVDLLLPP